MSLKPSYPFGKTLVVAVLLAAASVFQVQAANITNATVANVTPSSFTLVFSADGTLTLDVFADAAGTSNLVGNVGLEWDPVHTGNSGLTDETQRRLQRNALRAKARTLGLGHVRVSRLKPGIAYYYRITSRLNNVTNTYPSSGLASVTTALRNSFVPESQQLVIDVPGLDNDGRIVTLTHSNAAYAISAVVGDGAGTNQVFFNVADLLALGGQSNFTANGSQEFQVDLRGANNSHSLQLFTLVFDGAFSIAEGTFSAFGIEFSALTLGSTIMRAGNTGSVAVTFNSSVPIREITAQLQVPTARLLNLALSNLPPAVATAQIISNSPSSASLHVVMQAGQYLQGTFPFAQLWFTASSNQTSAFVPLSLTAPVLAKADGNSVSNLLMQPGRVVLIAQQPLLESFADPNGKRRIVLYGKPWSAYALEYSADLANTNAWRVHSRHPLTNMVAQISDMNGNSGSYFYRAAEVGGGPPALESLVGTNNTRRLLVFGQAGAQYTLQSAPSLSGVISWSNVLSYTLTNQFTYLNNLGTNVTATFYRLRKD